MMINLMTEKVLTFRWRNITELVEVQVYCGDKLANCD